ncbi:MarR family winged helix-turn-helix transcriptional regulator [Pokkaliibacter sp. CJK22405]|uniref:MarR family winged helix-turn-helix transcriptional regulator n=1 Tax=Pokkaliibacter sp. CJK22405 TaxID=3384615 RepID=UPI003984ED28
MNYSYGFHLHHLARLWRSALDSALNSVGLTQSTGIAIIHLAEAGEGISQRHLAEELAVEQPTLVRTLDFLVNKGLIERRPCPTDRRAKLLYLLPDGRAMVDRINSCRQQVQEDALAGISEDDLAALRTAFEAMHRNLYTLSERNKAVPSAVQEDTP